MDKQFIAQEVSMWGKTIFLVFMRSRYGYFRNGVIACLPEFFAHNTETCVLH